MVDVVVGVKWVVEVEVVEGADALPETDVTTGADCLPVVTVTESQGGNRRRVAGGFLRRQTAGSTPRPSR